MFVILFIGSPRLSSTSVLLTSLLTTNYPGSLLSLLTNYEPLSLEREPRTCTGRAYCRLQSVLQRGPYKYVLINSLPAGTGNQVARLPAVRRTWILLWSFGGET
eukprot:scaffold248610_cov49-Attheya_sp.AAC.1